MKLITFLLFLTFFLTGFSNWFYFFNNQYDSLRIYQIVILIVLLINSLLQKNFFYGNKQLYTSFLIILSCVISAYTAQYSNIAFIDFYLYFLIFNILYILKNLDGMDEKNLIGFSFIFALTPMLSVINIPFSILLNLKGVESNWYNGFSNFRMLDDAILPFLFLLWFIQDKSKNHSIKILITIISSFYLLSFLLNGARAVLLSLFLSLGVFGLNRFRDIKSLLYPFISFLIAIFIFFLYRLNAMENIGSELTRFGDSGRIDLWCKALGLFISNPLLGVGGSNFVFQHPILFSAHPHNLALQMLSEWGVIALLLIYLIVVGAIKLLKLRNKLNVFLLALYFSIVFNSMLSGSFIYPLSQMAILWSLVVVFFFYSKHMKSKNNNTNSIIFVAYRFNLVILLLVFIYIFLNLLSGYQVNVFDELLAPRFWLDGNIN